MRLPSFIHFYNGGKTENLDIEEVVRYLKSIFKESRIQIRDDFISYHLSRVVSKEKEKLIDVLAKKIARIRIQKLEDKITAFEPLPGEVDYEKKRMHDLGNKSFGILYDGFKLVAIFSSLIKEKESGSNHCHIIFTNQLFATWDEEDLRYHARVSVYGFPSIVSTTGIVEAPAKPREFYLKKQLGTDIYTLKEKFKDRFIDYNDFRMTEVMKGYVLQAVFYHIAGKPFCNNRNCRLFNAHWQEEVIRAQLNNKNGFCQEHQKLINYIKEIQ